MKYGSFIVLVLGILSGSQVASTQAVAPSPSQRDLDLVKEPPAKPPPATPTLTIPRSYALVVGIADYKDPKLNLKYTVHDADTIYTVLISPEGGQFPPENVHVLKDQDATLANLKYQLDTWLPSVAKDDDRVLIYFAGHGFLWEGTSYLAPYNLDRDHIAATGYKMGDLGDVIGNKIHAKWKVLLADACHSGAITPESDRAQVTKSLLDLNKSLFVVTASRDREVSLESPNWGGGHGIFTYYVVKGLEGQADTNGDGVVTAQELGDYVYTNVSQAAENLHQQQHPTFDRGSFDTKMVLAYNPNHVVAANLPPPSVGTLVIETNMDGVEVTVDGKSAGLVNKAKPLRLPGLQPGVHTIQGNREGYEPDGPRAEEIYPGQSTTVSLHILIARQRKKAAVDHFNRGLEFYNKGFEQNYKVAVEEFKSALQVDPAYSQAALYLGRAYRSLYDFSTANQCFKQAIEIDPDFIDARISYGGGLLDSGDFDEAIRQLTFVTQRDPNNGIAWYLISQAFCRKGVYDQAVHASQQAVKLIPNKAEAHLWLADSLRLSDSESRSTADLAQAESEYTQYLALSNFNSKLGGKLNYYVLPWLIGTGQKKRAAQTDIWAQLRAQADFGICDCEWMQKRIDPAIKYCENALSYDPQDLYAHFRLGTLYIGKAELVNGLDLLVEARKQFSSVIALNPDVDLAGNSQKYIQSIDQVLSQQR